MIASPKRKQPVPSAPILHQFVFIMCVAQRFPKVDASETKIVTKIFLLGHDKTVTAVGLSSPDQKLLCSCSSDKVIIWDLSCITEEEQISPGDSPVGVTVGLDLGYVESCAFSWNKTWLALCKEKEVWLLLIKFSPSLESANGPELIEEITHHTVLEANNCHGNTCTFSPEHYDLLVLVEDSNNFKVWDVRTSSVLYSSCNFGSHAVTYCMFATNPSNLLLGTNKGVVHIFTVGEKCTRSVMKLDVARTFLQQTKTPEVTYDEKWRSSTIDLTSVNVKSSVGIALFDYKSWDCLGHLTLQDMFGGMPVFKFPLPFVDYVVVGGTALSDISCVVKTTLGGASLRVVTLSAMRTTSNSAAREHRISVMPSIPVDLKSPLRYQMTMSEVSEYSTRGPRPKPVRKQKSSGYGRTLPRMQMFQPVVNRPKEDKSLSCSLRQLSKSSPNLIEVCDSTVMKHCGPPCVVGEKVCVWDTSGTAIHLAVSDSYWFAADCFSLLPHLLPIAFHNIPPKSHPQNIHKHHQSYQGHQFRCYSLVFFFSFDVTVSGSNDGTAMVWDWKHKNCLLKVDNNTRVPASCRTIQKDQSCVAVSQARFYYMDQFILLAVQGGLELFSHALYEDNPSTKRTVIFLDDGISDLALCGCSNKAVKVYDLNVEQIVLELPQAHIRAPHVLRQVEGSQSVSHHPAMYDLFLSAAVCDKVKMWDLRTARCVQNYCQHVNRAYTSGIDISPCGRYIAVSSDDKNVYIYDSRKCLDYIDRLSGLGDVVMDVAFNPCIPLLAAAALNGHVVTYTAQHL
uniref:WD repeat domain 27 n=1 Tax=Timema shepardi TaxID=629360 RepID=A0A7R9FVP9_TIMSH|nr:unnamed protein product [Timema shepardi]